MSEALRVIDVEDAPPPDGNNGRDSKGRFVKGNKIAPRVNTLSSRYLSLRNRALLAVEEGDVEEIVRGMVRDAKMGDYAAIKLLFTFVIGNAFPKEDSKNSDDDISSDNIPSEYARKLKMIYPAMFTKDQDE